MSDIDRQVTDLARKIAQIGASERARVFDMSWWSERMLDWAMSHEQFKTQLFRFVDVFPATGDDEDVLEHLEEYFHNLDVPPPLKLGLDAAEHVPFGKRTSALVARRNIRRMAQQFIVGDSPESAESSLRELWKHGSASTVDLLGEKTVTAEQADAYAKRVMQMMQTIAAAAETWEPNELLERDGLGPISRTNISVKPTALSPLFEPLTAREGIDQAKDRLRPILRRAAELNAFINLDSERYDVKDMGFALMRELLDEDEFSDLEAGLVVQAYLKDSPEDLEELTAWSSRRKRPITIRLVKGAYWDTETVVAAAQGWPSPVFQRKVDTDLNYEACVRMLHSRYGAVRAAFATHNLRSLAYAMVTAREQGIADDGYELQMLYGMAEPIQHAVRQLGMRLRIYCPVGELIPGMAYLVRRLLENTSNESFIRHRYAEGRSLEELIQPPSERPSAGEGEGSPEEDFEEIESGDADEVTTDSVSPGRYRPEPVAEFRRQRVRETFAAAVAAQAGQPVLKVPAFIAGEEVSTPGTIASIDPAAPRSEVARSAECGTAEAERAVAAAKRAWPEWSRTPASERAAVLFRAAEWMRRRRFELAALMVFEAGKPWSHSDADVCEAIDFCRYYGREMLRLDRGGVVQSPPGERNSLDYIGRGVGVVIAPWNFPLAIPTGMTVSGLVTGNCVILKPAEQTPAVAWQLVRALRAAGLPEGVLGFLPGYGEEVGAHLVAHPDVANITFTGSAEVGRQIMQTAAVVRPGQRQPKRVVAEMGGKNPLIIDSDADLDQAIPGAIESAFGYAGQRCSAASRLIVLDSVYEETLDRLVKASQQVLVGHPRRMGVSVGPLIGADAYERVNAYVAMGASHGKLALRSTDVPADGYFVGPTVVTDLEPASPVLTEEIFGPVLAVVKAGSFDEALALANDTDFGLTGGLYSRSPSHIRRVARELRAGNVYVNRSITGAVVGRQPFGGYGMSGVGSKAGGPDYLIQFMNPRAVTENTMRQGFAPETMV
ncbi:MAG: proline dehydrogenase family protein [Actinobacteria bacterium]|nr:proline dehydrogenase family protein [Actinomycetota bacterium]